MNATDTPSQLPVLSVDLLRAYDRSEHKPEGWSRDHAAQGLHRYRQWLLLAQRYPGRPLAPTHDIDVLWHLHILCPRAYAEDCHRLFGYMLDHDGGFGKDEAELPVLERTFRETEALWEREFGEPYIVEAAGGSTKCWHDCKSRCWHACSTKQ